MLTQKHSRSIAMCLTQSRNVQRLSQLRGRYIYLAPKGVLKPHLVGRVPDYVAPHPLQLR